MCSKRDSIPLLVIPMGAPILRNLHWTATAYKKKCNKFINFQFNLIGANEPQQQSAKENL